MKTFTSVMHQERTEELSREVLDMKITQLGTALFYTENGSLLKLPVHVISDVKIDAEGQIWFLIPRPVQQLNQFETALPARLNFFRKGKSFYIKVKGVATMVSLENEDLSNIMDFQDLQRISNGELVAVKVKVRNIEHTDPSSKPAQSWLQSTFDHLPFLAFLITD